MPPTGTPEVAVTESASLTFTPLMVTFWKLPKSLPLSTKPDVRVIAYPSLPPWSAQSAPEVGKDCV